MNSDMYSEFNGLCVPSASHSAVCKDIDLYLQTNLSSDITLFIPLLNTPKGASQGSTRHLEICDYLKSVSNIREIVSVKANAQHRS
jgi:hypothetical protein